MYGISDPSRTFERFDCLPVRLAVSLYSTISFPFYTLIRKDYTKEYNNIHYILLFQIQLEKIREADHQVRWQHEEDVDDCPTCHTQFSNPKRKQHCRHCGQIFCPNCVTRVVQSGPNMRPSKVCDVCHTLLVKSSAPYFSKEPPMT